MSTARTIIQCNADGESTTWIPTTLDQLNKSEEFFESVLARSPELMGLETRRSGIRGPYRIFRQLSLDTPAGRTIYPDIVLLAASGHVMVVEVKRYVNSELRDRHVIAQIIDYASSFSAQSDEQLVRLFKAEGNAAQTWPDLIVEMFPDEPHIEELSTLLANRLRDGNLHLIIACDKVPPGVVDIVAGIASQSAVAFDLDLVEVTPYVREISDNADILFVPTPRLATEIVSRTAVTVTHQVGDSEPGVQVTTATLEEIEKTISSAQQGKPWSAEEVEQEILAGGDATAIALLQFAKEHSVDGKYVASGRRLNAVVRLHVAAKFPDGSVRNRVLFSYTHGWGGIYLYLGFVQSVTPPEVDQ